MVPSGWVVGGVKPPGLEQRGVVQSGFRSSSSRDAATARTRL